VSRRGDATVYSSERGRICPHCGLPIAKCACRTSPRTRPRESAGDRIVRVGREKKGRRGKTVTTVTGLPLAPDELRELASQLKRRCGSGGTLSGSTIEVQGDHRDVLVEELTGRGFTVKRSGG
jgi:translation initiation factor 1